MFIRDCAEQIRQCRLEPDEGAYECCDAEKAEGNIDLNHDHRDFGLSAHERNLRSIYLKLTEIRAPTESARKSSSAIALSLPSSLGGVISVQSMDG